MLDLLNRSIQMFNDLFYDEGLPYELKTDVKLYSIKPSKKSGKPESDMPSKINFIIKLEINLMNLVHETNMDSFSIILDEKNLMENPRNIKKENIFDKCKNCSIF